MDKENKINSEKPGIIEMAGLVIILLLLLIFPYIMITQHIADIKADSYYKTK